MNPSRVKWLILIFLLISFCTPLFVFLTQSCVLLGLADGQEWAHKKLVAVLAAVDEQDTAQNLQTLQIAHFNSFNSGSLFLTGVSKSQLFL